jgi:zinc transport system ATP-binding protein
MPASNAMVNSERMDEFYRTEQQATNHPLPHRRGNPLNITTMKSLEVLLPPLVAIRNLTVARGGRPVLDNLSCDIANGKITALVGLNGCGKSTLLRTLVGEFPFRGSITFACGEDHSRPRPDHVGYVPQKLQAEGAFPLTVRDLIGITHQSRPLALGTRRQVVERIMPVLKRVGVDNRLDVPLEGLSGGQMQRVLLALAMEPMPELLLLDEPAAGIDFKDQQSFYDLIGEINRDSGVTVVLVSHDLPTVRRLAHQVMLISAGRVVREGPPQDVLTEMSIREVFVQPLF